MLGLINTKKERVNNMTAADSLIGLVNPKPNSTVMIYDVMYNMKKKSILLLMIYINKLERIPTNL